MGKTYTEKVDDLMHDIMVGDKTYTVEDDHMTIHEIMESDQINEDDAINHPSHYNRGKYECIDIIEDLDLGYHLGNAFKYIYRAGHKGCPVQDLKKAVWFINRKIEELESGNL